MKFRWQILLTIVVVIFLAFFIYEAKEWRLQARLYPWVIGIPVFFLALIQLILDLKGASKKEPSGAAPTDFQFTVVTDKAVALRRTLNIFSWILGFLVGIWLVGFSLAVPLLVFLYLKVQSREAWALSVALTAAAWLLFWGLFDRLLRLPFPDGQLLTWLGF